MGQRVVRLYSQFQPEKYNITIDIDKEKMRFSGTVEIYGAKTGRPSKRLTFHQKELKITSAKVIHESKNGLKEIDLVRVNHHKAYDEIRLHSEHLLYPGKYQVKLGFSGQISRKMHGIYPCFYKDGDNEKTIIATQFESHFAREAFPCIDEPEAKAVFNLTLITSNNEEVLSNTLPKSSKPVSGKKETKFYPTPVMSSYLLAFAVGDIHCVEGKTKDGIVVRSWASNVQPKSHLKYANSEAIKILEFFSEYFKTPFPLKKLDQIALPDFEAGAMENWGLITYREVLLLADPLNRSISSEQTITLVIAHEISHQWFGNLVTMKWWDDLWLNESFASIMENIAPDRLHPDWHQWEDFTTGRVLSSSHRDIYKDVQPVGVKVKHPDEIVTLFDPAIVYAKGARLLSMLLEYIGEDNFRKSLHLYFTKNAYSNTTRNDLWEAMSNVSGKDIGSLMSPWIEQSGQPLISASLINRTLLLSQKRFLMDSEDNKSTWPVPLLASPPLQPDILKKKKANINTPKNATPILNINGSGHYIVKYVGNEMFNNLAVKITSRKVSPISRITLLNDMLLLARAGEYNLPMLLNIVKDCSKEPRDAVWSILIRVVGHSQVLTDSILSTENDINNFKKVLSSYWYNKLGWQDKKDDDPNTLHLRTTALALSIGGENKKAVNEAIEKFNNAGSVEKLPAEHRALIAGTAVRFGNKSVVTRLMSEYESSLNPDVKQSITSALCSTKDESVAKQIIKWGLKPDGPIKDQDIDHWFAYLMRNHYTRSEAWKWFTSSWDYLFEKFSGGKNMETFVWYSAGPLSTPAWQKKFNDFYKPKVKYPAMKRNILIALSEIETRVKWRAREEAGLIKYFKSEVSR